MDAVPDYIHEDFIENEDRVFGHWDEECWDGDGASTAALAAGDDYGVAKHANLYFVKTYWGYIHPEDEALAGEIALGAQQGHEPQILVTMSGSYLSLSKGLERIKKIVEERNLQRKAVVLMSRREYFPSPIPTI